MKNRKSAMALSAILILIFHFWVNVFPGNDVENFIKLTAYIGVDMFFFLSAYSMAGREVDNYLKFIVSRFKGVYLKYTLFVILDAVLISAAAWSFSRFLKALVWVELFKKGGGAFLWFLPAIMLFYMAFPLLQKADQRNPVVTAIVSLALWAVVAFLVTRFTGYKEMFIFWNRIPIFLLGFYVYKLDKWIKGFCIRNEAQSLNKNEAGRTEAREIETVRNETGKNADSVRDRGISNRMAVCVKLVLAVVFVAVGAFLLLKFGYKIKLKVPFRDMFYVIAIPMSLGLIALAGFVPSVKPISWIGSSTLEIYGVQMVIGYNIAKAVMKYTREPLLVSLLVILPVIVIAVVVHYLYGWIEKKR